MATALIASLSLLVLGMPVALALDRSIRGPLLIGTAYLYGSGLIFLLLLALAVLHIPWTLVTVTAAALVLASGIWLISYRVKVAAPRPPIAFHWLDLLSILTLIDYAMFATIAPVWEWDFWAIWGLKARVFFEHRGIDWRFLESPWNAFAHTDYPQLLSFNYDFFALVNGSWSDRWLGVVMVGCAAAVVLIVRAIVAEETTPIVAALIAAAVATIAASRYIGLAEGPMIAFGGAALLFIRRAIVLDDEASWRHGAVLLGLAANVKNEGVALATSVAFALAILRPRRIVRLWPAAALIAPWLILRATHVLPTDIVAGSVVDRVLSRLPHTADIALLLWADLFQRPFWILVVAGVAIAPRERIRREAFLLLATAAQLAFYVGSYFATPHDPRWHIVTSWPRLTMQLALPFTVAVLLMLAVSFPTNAEARSVD